MHYLVAKGGTRENGTHHSEKLVRVQHEPVNHLELATESVFAKLALAHLQCASYVTNNASTLC